MSYYNQRLVYITLNMGYYYWPLATQINLTCCLQLELTEVDHNKKGLLICNYIYHNINLTKTSFKNTKLKDVRLTITERA